jgi:hypothetical protein
MSEKRLFRKFAGDAIKNSHTAIKNCWLILFTGGTFALVSSLDVLVNCATFLNTDNQCVGLGLSSSPWTLVHWLYVLFHFSFFVVYALTFYRFYVGDARVFDIRYDEVFKFFANAHDEQVRKKQSIDEKEVDNEYQKLFNYNDILITKESIFLIGQTLLVVYLAAAVLHPLKFLAVYELVLLSDIIWILWTEQEKQREAFSNIFFEKFFSTFPELKKIEKPIQAMFPRQATSFWRKNNLSFAIVIFILIIAISAANIAGGDEIIIDALLAIGALAMLANCALDLVKTWTFYNPHFHVAHALICGMKLSPSEEVVGDDTRA